MVSITQFLYIFFWEPVQIFKHRNKRTRNDISVTIRLSFYRTHFQPTWEAFCISHDTGPAIPEWKQTILFRTYKGYTSHFLKLRSERVFLPGRRGRWQILGGLACQHDPLTSFIRERQMIDLTGNDSNVSSFGRLWNVDYS